MALGGRALACFAIQIFHPKLFVARFSIQLHIHFQKFFSKIIHPYDAYAFE